MAVRKIVTVDVFDEAALTESTLRLTPAPVVEFDASVSSLVSDLIDTMEHQELAIGLAAPQIGESYQIAVVDKQIVGSDEHLILINPEILGQSGKKDIKRESCMSLPPWGGDVEMRRKLQVRYQDQSAETLERTFEGFAARVVRHECDHLQSVLFIDHVQDLSAMEKLEMFEDYEG